ncbi:MAG: hypothetical protein WC332_01025 [Clostridia bacterium]|jgi:phage gp37-like protein
MNKYEKVTFITDLIRNVQGDILKKVDKLPEDWDGWELRQLVADYFTNAAFFTDNDKRRKKEYKNTVLVNNLI